MKKGLRRDAIVPSEVAAGLSLAHRPGGSTLILGGAVLVLAHMAVRLVSQPIPIAIEGGLKVYKLVLPPTLNISSKTPSPIVVRDEVTVANKHH